MFKPLRLLVIAAVLSITAAGVASAQTVLLKGAAPGETLEVVVNSAQPVTATVGADGQATAVGQLPLNANNRPEMDARVYVDACDKRRRVLILDRNMLAPARETGCDRREIGGVFLMRQRSTVVVDVSGAIPTLLLRQGEYDPNAATARREAPRGIVLFAGGGWGGFEDQTGAGCGNIGECEGKSSGGTYTAGAAVWLTRFFAVEGSYLKPRKASYEGSGTNFRFTYFLDADILTAGGKLAVPIGAVRLYGMGGGAFHKATSSTTQTNDPLSFESNGVQIEVEGGTQTIQGETEGWGWYGGGGIEGWVSPRVGLFGEGLYVKLKGDPTSGTDIPMDSHFFAVVAGLRFKLF